MNLESRMSKEQSLSAYTQLLILAALSYVQRSKELRDDYRMLKHCDLDTAKRMWENCKFKNTSWDVKVVQFL